MKNDPGRANRYLVKNTLVAAFGGLLFGFDTAVIAGATHALTETYRLTPGLLGVTVSSALVGTVIGAMCAGIFADRFGRVVALRTLATLYILSALGCAGAPDWSAFLLFRVIGGLAIGGSSVIGPMYIAEIAPAAKRGRLVGLFQVNVVCGLLLAYFSNYMIGLAAFGESEWRWKLGVAALPAVCYLAALVDVPQSPRWLVREGRMQEAEEVFQSLGEPNPTKEVADIMDSLESEIRRQTESLFSAKYRFPIFLAVSMGMFNQLTGINAITYYLNDIFATAGFNKVSSDIQAVVIGCTNLVFTIIAMTVIDRIGRKKLLLIGAAGTCVCLACVATVFATGTHQSVLIWILICYIAFFAFSQGAVIWVYLSEIFPSLVRAKGQSLGSFTHWIMNALISGVFPLLAAASGAVPFLFFSVMVAVQFVVVLLFYPETKGLALEDVADRSKLAASRTGQARSF
jgi:MFS transporter, SP family, arabinose:H+ symporter